MAENRWYLTPILNTWATPNEDVTLRGWANGGSGDGQSGEAQIRYISMTITPNAVTEDNSSDVVVSVVAPQSVPDGTTVGYTIGGAGITVDDITLESLTGTLTVTGGQASLTFRVRLDGLPVPVETATETLTFTLDVTDSIGTVVGLDPISLTISNAPFYGSIVSFSQPDNSQQYDVITDNVTLTRNVGGGGGALWNSVFESDYDMVDYLSPYTTLWAKSPETAFFDPSTLNYSNFYNYFSQSVGNNILSGDYNPVVMYSMLDNQYYEFNFSSWTQGGAGGFQYSRKKINYELNEPLVTVQDLTPLEIVVDVASAGTAEFLHFIPYSNSTEGYHYSIDWGDGTPAETGSTVASLSHDYAAAGTYTVSIKTQRLTPALYSSKLNNIVVTDISQWGDTVLSNPMYMFYGSDIVSFSATDTPTIKGNVRGFFQNAGSFNDPNVATWDVSGITNMANMFSGATAFNQDLNLWDTSKVTNMNRMFGFGSYNGDITTWNTGAVTDMGQMFEENAVFNQDIGGWDTSSVINMFEMFQDATVFNQDISGWDTSSVTDMSYMFHNASAFNQPIGNWDVSKVTTLEKMFDAAEVFNQDLSNWNTGSVTNMYAMFETAYAFNSDITTWDTSSVTDMRFMFNQATVFNQPIGSWDTSSVTDMSYMFYFATSFNQPLNGWDVSNVTSMQQMFEHAEIFNQDLDQWNTISVTTMYSMFNYAYDFNGDISTWNVSNVTTMYEMFNYAYDFNQDLSGWDVSSVQSFEETFFEARAFNADISGWDVSAATNMYRMFDDARAFNQDIGGWNVSNVTNMDSMFEDAYYFDQDLSGWDVTNIASLPDQFADATGSFGPNGGWDVSKQPVWGTSGA